MGSLSDYLQGKLLDHVYRSVTYTPPTTVYLALFTVSQSSNGVDGVEVVGGSYARQPLLFDVAVVPGGSIATLSEITFLNMPDADIVGGATYDDLTAGNLLQLGDLPLPRTVVAGDNLSLLAGDLTLYLQ